MRQAQGAAVPGCPGAAQQRQPGGRHRHRGAEDGEQIPAAKQQRLVDGGVVAEPAAGDQEPEGDPDPDGADARPAVHSAPPVMARAANVTATAAAKNIAVAARESGEPAAQPDSPCPDVHPSAQRAP
jgi:hypothetical protein